MKRKALSHSVGEVRLADRAKVSLLKIAAVGRKALSARAAAGDGLDVAPDEGAGYAVGGLAERRRGVGIGLLTGQRCCIVPRGAMVAGN